MAQAPKEDYAKELELPTPQIDKPEILFWIARNKNLNIVVYEATRTEKGGKFDGVDGYWLDIDPELSCCNLPVQTVLPPLHVPVQQLDAVRLFDSYPVSLL